MMTSNEARPKPRPPLRPDDLKLANLERQLLESYVLEDDVALRGVAMAYEIALADRYPRKVRRIL